ncbi:MAG: BlaI/MecI/CopY family transcriptional regulator [Eubacterium sp.]|nr:BlaI/MecI/CopY family transcriptional regulator [Eubacterium sp.]
MGEETVKLFDSELKVMDIIWKEGGATAKYVADTLAREIGWNKNTTYTLIKRCIKKGAIQRSEPHFMCHALIPKEKVQEAETNALISKLYDGSVDKLFASLLGSKKLSAGEIQSLKKMVDELEKKESVQNG